MPRIISFGIIESLGYVTILGKILGMGEVPRLSFEFISRIVLNLFVVIVLIVIGYKIKGVWGAGIAFLFVAFFFLYINGLLPI